jgi:hypothetical protein
MVSPKFGVGGLGMEQITLTFTREEAEVLQSALEVIVDGHGTYMMLRLPRLVKIHDGLLDKFSAAIGRKREMRLL